MNQLWTWSGKYVGYFDGDDLWAYDGRHIGKLRGSEVYDAAGKYLGEKRNQDRLVFVRSKSHRKSAPFLPLDKRLPTVPRSDAPTYLLDFGHDDFALGT